MQRPRLIATDAVIAHALDLIKREPLAKAEYDKFLARTDTVFKMDLLSYGEPIAPLTIMTPAFVLPMLTIPAVQPLPEPEATPLSFLSEAGMFEPKPAASHPLSHSRGGLKPEALGLKPKGYHPNEIAKVGLSRMQALGAAWRLSTQEKYLQRGIDEMLALCALPHWGTQFLATGTMMHAVALGYDWLHSRLSEGQKLAVRQALLLKGIEPALVAFEANPQPNWIRLPCNWNIVCNAALIMAALAIENDEPDPRVAVIKALALENIQIGMKLFHADGSWLLEGPGYWHLASEHLTYLLAALDTAAGSELELIASHPVRETGRYRCYMSGPTGQLFNFGDSEERRPGLWWLRWHGTAYNSPMLHEIAEDRSGVSGAAPEIHPMDVLWRRPAPAVGAASALDALPTAKVFCEAAVMRGAWGDPNAAYVGIKGGRTSGRRSHSHLDLGHFVYEAGGVRWAIDLEPEEYSDCYLTPPERYMFYRANTFGHNTLTIGDENQAFAPADASEPPILATFSNISETAQSKSVQVDMTAAYPGIKSVQRTFSLDHGGALTIVDEIASDAPVHDVIWSMHTRAAVTCDGRYAQLHSMDDGKEMILHAWVQGDDGVEFDAAVAGPAIPYVGCKKEETMPPGVTRLTLRVATALPRTRLMVRFSLSPA
jgi:Heparinase II/III-like protein